MTGVTTPEAKSNWNTASGVMPFGSYVAANARSGAAAEGALSTQPKLTG